MWTFLDTPVCRLNAVSACFRMVCPEVRQKSTGTWQAQAEGLCSAHLCVCVVFVCVRLVNPVPCWCESWGAQG